MNIKIDAINRTLDTSEVIAMHNSTPFQPKNEIKRKETNAKVLQNDKLHLTKVFNETQNCFVRNRIYRKRKLSKNCKMNNKIRSEPGVRVGRLLMICSFEMSSSMTKRIICNSFENIFSNRQLSTMNDEADEKKKCHSLLTIDWWLSSSKLEKRKKMLSTLRRQTKTKFIRLFPLLLCNFLSAIIFVVFFSAIIRQRRQVSRHLKKKLQWKRKKKQVESEETFTGRKGNGKWCGIRGIQRFIPSIDELAMNPSILSIFYFFHFRFHCDALCKNRLAEIEKRMISVAKLIDGKLIVCRERVFFLRW